MSRPAILDALAVASLAVALCDDAVDRVHRARHETDDELERDELHAAADDLSTAWRHAHRARAVLQVLAQRVQPAPRPVTPLDVARRAGWVS